MDFSQVIRLVIMTLSGGAMAVGVAVMAGWLVPVGFPQQFRIPMGAVVFLYGAYRFVVAYFRPRERGPHESR